MAPGLCFCPSPARRDSPSYWFSVLASGAVVLHQVALAHKDAQLQQLAAQRAGLEARLGNVKVPGTSHADFVSRCAVGWGGRII